MAVAVVISRTELQGTRWYYLADSSFAPLPIIHSSICILYLLHICDIVQHHRLFMLQSYCYNDRAGYLLLHYQYTLTFTTSTLDAVLYFLQPRSTLTNRERHLLALALGLKIGRAHV